MTATVCPEIVAAAAQSLVTCQPGRQGKGVIVTTSALYPDGSAVQVMVKLADEGYWVSDGGRGLMQIRATGHQSGAYGLHLSRAAGTLGVDYSRGMVEMRGVSVAALEAAIALVANASAHGVVRTMEHFNMPKTEAFRLTFDTYIRKEFGNAFRPELFDGKNQSHSLNYVYRNGRLVITEPLQPDRMSVKTAYSDFADILGAQQRPDNVVLVFDGAADWESGDLEHLRSLGSAVEVVEYDAARARLPTLVPVAAQAAVH